MKGVLPVTQGHWTVVETLGPADTWSVLAIDGKPTEWKSLARALPVGVLAVVTKSHDARAEITQVLAPSRSRKVGDFVRALPIPAPDGSTLGVQVWVGDNTSSEPRTTAGFTFSTDTRLLAFDDSAHDKFQVRRVEGRSNWTVPELFRLVEQFDDGLDLIIKTIACEPDDRWLGQLALRTGGRSRTVQLALRNGSDTERTSWRGFVHELTDTAAPAPVSLEAAALATLRTRGTPVFIALMELSKGRLIRWITDPLPGIQWKGIVDDRDTPHPDDVTRIFDAAGDIVAGRATATKVDDVRLRRVEGGWTVVDAVGTLLPYGDIPSLALIELTVTGTSDDPDPVPAPATDQD